MGLLNKHTFISASLKISQRLYHRQALAHRAGSSGYLVKLETGQGSTSQFYAVKFSPLQKLLIKLYNKFPWLVEASLSKANIINKTMGDMELVLPESIRGMKALDRETFNVKYQIPVLKIPVASIKVIVKNAKVVQVLRRPGVRPIADLDASDPDSKTHKLILLHPSKYKSVDSFNEDEKEMLTSLGIDLSSWSFMDIGIGYENWNYNEILKAILPADSDGVAGFSQIGHIVHLNLKEELVDYRQIIGVYYVHVV